VLAQANPATGAAGLPPFSAAGALAPVNPIAAPVPLAAFGASAILVQTNPAAGGAALGPFSAEAILGNAGLTGSAAFGPFFALGFARLANQPPPLTPTSDRRLAFAAKGLRTSASHGTRRTAKPPSGTRNAN